MIFPNPFVMYMPALNFYLNSLSSLPLLAWWAAFHGKIIGMRVALFIPCYIDQFYPQVARAALELLERLGCEVIYPLGQTCCGQPMANAGCERDALQTYHHFVKTFSDFPYIVSPSGSCVYHVRQHYDVINQTAAVQAIRERTLELSEFLIDVLGVQVIPGARYPHRVGIHASCHGLRGLRLGPSSELRGSQPPSGIQHLLTQVADIEIVPLDRTDECCGFGGTFAVSEASVSVKMGADRLADHLRNGVEVVTASDMSCLMHLEGIIRRRNYPLRVAHYAEILNTTGA